MSSHIHRSYLQESLLCIEAEEEEAGEQEDMEGVCPTGSPDYEHAITGSPNEMARVRAEKRRASGSKEDKHGTGRRVRGAGGKRGTGDPVNRLLSSMNAGNDKLIHHLSESSRRQEVEGVKKWRHEYFMFLLGKDVPVDKALKDQYIGVPLEEGEKDYKPPGDFYVMCVCVCLGGGGGCISKFFGEISHLQVQCVGSILHPVCKHSRRSARNCFHACLCYISLC